MINISIHKRNGTNGGKQIDLNELGEVLRLCRDLPMLENSFLTNHPRVKTRAKKYNCSLGLAKALRAELISCAEQITIRPTYPIEKIVDALESYFRGNDQSELIQIRNELAIPFSRDKIDLARFYSIRLSMEGVNRQQIAEFLQVEPRTVANYTKQAKERIKVLLEY
jgi:hypothetical protein